MKQYTNLLWACYILATLGLIAGIISKITGFVVLGLAPLSYLRFTGICLLYSIAFSLSQMTLKKTE